MEFAPGANGDATPVATLSGPAAGLVNPYQLVFDADGHLWVANNGNDTVTEYAPGAHGNTAPIATLSSRVFGDLHGIGFDPVGRLQVADGARNAIYSFAPGASGQTAQISTIIGAFHDIPLALLEASAVTASGPVGQNFPLSGLALEITGSQLWVPGLPRSGELHRQIDSHRGFQ